MHNRNTDRIQSLKILKIIRNNFLIVFDSGLIVYRKQRNCKKIMSDRGIDLKWAVSFLRLALQSPDTQQFKIALLPTQ